MASSTRPAHPRCSVAVALIFWALGCEGVSGPLYRLDDGGVEGPDDQAPRVVDTSPADGVDRVPTDTPLRIRFSEPMRPAAGEVAVQPAGVRLFAADGTWNGAGDELTLRMPGGWPPGAEVEAEVAGFLDDSGTPMASSVTIRFATRDQQPPELVETDPVEGAVGVPPGPRQVRLAFSEPMRPEGSLELRAGDGSVGEPVWVTPRLASVPLSDLRPSTRYSLAVGGFLDRAGNALAPAPVLGDGRLDFTTGPDVVAPRVVSASPDEGSSVGLDRDAVILSFSEPMDTSRGEATLRIDGGEPVGLDGTWSDGDRTLALDLAGHIGRPYSAHRVVLDGYADTAGNALDPVPVLGDGALDFTVGASPEPPRVVASSPPEGATDVPVDTLLLSVSFSEPMDTSVSTADLLGGPAPVSVPVRWSVAGTQATFVVTDTLYAGRAYRLALGDFEDASGTALASPDPLTGDGQLDFDTAAPEGEACRSALTVAEGSAPAPGVVEWDIPRDSVVRRDAGALCGFAEGSADAVIAYDKGTGDLASGGRLLHVSAEVIDPSTARYVTVGVTTGACNPLDAAAVQVTCTAESASRDLFLDVPAGRYWIWLARPTRASDAYQPELRVRVSEPAAAPEGESCLAPFTTASPEHSGDGTPSSPHRWVIGGSTPSGTRAIVAPDMSAEPAGPDTVSCDLDRQGADAVLRVPKTLDDSVLEVRVHVNVPDTATASERVTRFLDVQASRECGPPRHPVRCERRVEDDTLFVPGPAGDLFLWLAGESPVYRWPLFPVEVEVTEVPTGPGDSCASALPATTGDNPVEPTAVRIEPPPVIGAPTAVTWYRYTPASDGIVAVTPDAPAPVGLADPATGTTLQQTPDGQAVPLAWRVHAGEPVCLALPGDGSVGSFAIEQQPYAGVGDAVTDLGIDFPPNSIGGCTTNLSFDYWLAASPTTLYLGISSNILEMPRSGATTALLRDTDDGVRSYGSTGTLGYAGATVGERLFSLYDTSVGSYRRLYEMWDASGAFWSPRAWDEGASYPSATASALTFDGTSLLYAVRTDPPQIWAASPDTPGTATLLGTVPVHDVIGLAADAANLYLAGYADGRQGIFRVARADVGDPAAAPTLLAPTYSFSLWGTDPTRAPSSSATTAMALDDLASPSHLYFRPRTPGTPQVVVDPGGPRPLFAGPVADLGAPGDLAMGFDPGTDEMFLFTTADATCGAIWRVQ